MILPAEHANAIRKMTTDGGDGGDTHIHNHFHVETPVTGGVRRLFMNNQQPIRRRASAAMQNG